MGLFVICNMEFLAKRSEMWKRIQESVEEVDALDGALTVKCEMHGKEQVITCGEDFDAKCREGGCDDPCNTRLNCGHMCPKPCHVEDMDHLVMKCLKPCAQTCPAEEKHPCKKRCYQACGDCKINVTKFLPCGHTKMDHCYLEAGEVLCVERCTETLQCFHRCDQLCGAPCTTKCQVIIKRQLPNCGHIVLMKCFDNPYTFKCHVIVPKQWTICGHTVDVPCYINVLTTTCPNPCNTALPGCEHLCQGTCGSCRNGRLHIRCEEKCKKVLICGHECESNCSNSCPPCQKLCQTACAHSQCGKKSLQKRSRRNRRKNGSKGNDKDPTSGRVCGDPCPPCAEKCLNKCWHRSCSKKCSDPCNVEPCNERCQKLLRCNPKRKSKNKKNAKANGTEENAVVADPLHLCIGVCGEECLKICKICNPKKLQEIQEIFFGTEEDEDAKFLQLKDCGHIFEVSGLDQWITSKLPNNDDNTIEIVEICCPRCKTPIRKSKRYIGFLNQRAADIEQIKHRIRGLTIAERKNEQKKFSAEINNLFKPRNSINSINFAGMETLYDKFMEEPPTLMTKTWFTSARNLLQIVKKLLEHKKHAYEHFQQSRFRSAETLKPLCFCDQIKGMLKINDFLEYINQEFDFLIKRIDMKEMSEIIIAQLDNEVSRFGFINEILIYMNQLYKANEDLEFEHANNLYHILKSLFGSKDFKDAFERKLWIHFKTIVKAHPVKDFGISEKERIDIVKALDGAVTKWYKCPNGHLYGIGDCGQAMVETKCPECGTVIGGENHRLQAGNSDATTEMRHGLSALQIQDPFVVRHGREW